MVKVERTPTPPPSLAVEKSKANGSYNLPDVVEALKRDFHEKCYLCENNALQAPEVEHLNPHGGNLDRKFEWQNLFLCCSHCNSVKNQAKYHDKILDCCDIDPETVLNQQIVNNHVSVTPLNSEEKSLMTAELITECFEKRNTGIRIYECQTLINELNSTMNTLYKTLAQYEKSRLPRYLYALCGMLSRTYKFSGFTRTYVRSHLTEYPYLAEYVEL